MLARVELAVAVAVGVAVLWVILAGGTGRATRSFRQRPVQAWKVYVWEWGPVGRQPAQFEALVNATDDAEASARALALLAGLRRKPAAAPSTRCVPFSATLHESELLVPLHDRDRASLPPWAWPPAS